MGQSAVQLRFIILTAVGALAYAAVGVNSPLIGLYLEDLGASFRAISGVFTTYVAVLIAANYLWGRLIDRTPYRTRLLVITLSGAAASFWIMSQVPSYQAAWLTRISEAVFVAGYTTLSLTLVGDLLTRTSRAPENTDKTSRTGRRMGIYRGLGSASFALGALVGGRLADAQGLSAAFALCAVFYMAAGVLSLTLALVRDPAGAAPIAVAPEAASQTPRTGQGRFRLDLPVLFLVGVGLWTAAHSASAGMWPNYMARLGYNASQIGALWGLAAAVEMPAMYGAGLLSDIFGRGVILVSGGLGIAVTNTGYMLAAAFLPALIVIQLVRGYGFGSFTAASMTLTAESSSAGRRGRGSGTYYAAAGVGQLIGMSLGGNLVQSFGFSVLFAVCASLAAASALSFWVMNWRQRNTPPSE
jgi:MFS family permease